jgi:hypothetical protein
MTTASYLSTEEHQQLTTLFSSYRAEWLKTELFDVFTEPTYFPQLRTHHPCFLVGGRGTGKTTALKCLSYEGQHALHSSGDFNPAAWSFYGIYHRVNTNRVTAFKGPELPESTWIRLFSHYINLRLCGSIFEFLGWYSRHTTNTEFLDADDLEEFASSINLNPTDSTAAMARALRLELLRFEALVNNIGDAVDLPPLSIPGGPIDALTGLLQTKSEFAGRQVFFLIDEYENFEDYQQRVLNTLIKHAGEAYTFKIGVRELGFRQRSTLNENEQLVDPADYIRIDIVDQIGERFEDFAASVCDRRMQKALPPQVSRLASIRDYFPEVTAEQEAILLGVEEQLPAIQDKVRAASSRTHSVWFETLRPLEQYVLNLLSATEPGGISALIVEAKSNPTKWRQRYDNYRHAALFTIRRRKRGIRKHYAGWKVFCRLAAGNIRYLLELVDSSLLLHLDESEALTSPIPTSTQTKAAQETGRKNLRELEGLSVYGAKLTKLLLALGRVFQVMAENPEGHAPEVNQFYLSAKSSDSAETAEAEHKVAEILRAAVMHLALLRISGSKLQDPADTREYDYTIHPVFAPFFGFSHRRKRKMQLSAQDVLTLIYQPAEGINNILSQQNRAEETDLPEQLRLFESFYAAHL